MTLGLRVCNYCPKGCNVEPGGLGFGSGFSEYDLGVGLRVCNYCLQGCNVEPEGLGFGSGFSEYDF